MKITKLRINHWRNFENIQLDIPVESTLVALIGENGVGKSSLLDVVNSIAHRLGLSAGVDIPRGDPFNDDHDFWIEAVINRNERNLLPVEQIQRYSEAGMSFDGRISLKSSKNAAAQSLQIYLTAYPDHSLSSQYANEIVQALRQKADTFHLSLDADRAYPPRPVQSHEYGQSLEQDWASVMFRKNRAFTSSRSKYEDWMKFCVGMEARKATESFQAARLAQATGTEVPPFVDHFAPFARAVHRVLPHLQFLGVDTKEKTLMFNSTGGRVSFDKLSGGEREIAFVVGQIERFELQNGILLIDEPELHLNPEMVRNWVSYLRDTVQEGQTWIATHSMEAVEAAGLECTFVIQRDLETKRVRDVKSLVDQPVLSVLSAAVGSPAFSLAKKRFMFIEGDRQGVERDKFFRLCGLLMNTGDIRFMEGGGCKEVERKVEACKILAESADQQINVGGIVDMDFRQEEEVTRLTTLGLYVLPFHEIENAFIYPRALNQIISRLGGSTTGEELVRNVADKLAGKWIFGRAKSVSDINIINVRELNTFWANIKWSHIENDGLGAISMPSVHYVAEGQSAAFEHALHDSYRLYSSIRTEGDLWARCEGKQVLAMLPSELGFSKQIALVNSLCTIFKETPQMLEEFLGGLLTYIENLR
ncbi:ATP-binding protein [Burkholderia multivorans]|uniref:ATP-binding protein n=1 Tax=Burkholderia multivorans TaxID=87883 RepID=UPI001C2420CB|nr:ATP-binding protein [Burkholderia multivorans]MBU9312769.1 AAA family ATPase [Burkholderia multivorans]